MGPKTGEKYNQKHNHKPCDRAFIAEKMNCHALPVALGGEVLIGGNVVLLQQRKVLLAGSVIRRGLHGCGCLY